MRFKQVRMSYSELWLQLLQVLLIFGVSNGTDSGVDYVIDHPKLMTMTTLPKCKGAQIPENELELPRSLVAAQDMKNNPSETLSFKLVDEPEFRCEAEQGRVASLTVSLDKMKKHNMISDEVATFFRSGYMVHDKTYFSREQYCIRSVNVTLPLSFTMSVKICEPKCSTRSTACVRKCCEPGKVLDLKHYANETHQKLSCEPSGGPTKEWHPFLYHNKYDKLSDEESARITLRYLDSHPKKFCDSGSFLVTLKDFAGIEASPFRVLKNGKVTMKFGRSTWENMPPTVYCVDGAINFGSEGDIPEDHEDTDTPTTSPVPWSAKDDNGDQEYSGLESDTVMMVCADFLVDPEAAEGGPNLLYVGAMMIASVFLFLTAVVYAIVWKRQSVHGWTFLGYVVSLLLTFVFLSCAHLMSSGDHDCTFVGIACHFFFLSTFAWLTTLNFDVYWTFRSLNPNPGRRKEIIRFLCYSAFGLGVPVIIVSVGLILDSIYGDDPESEVIVPRYGVTRCTMDRSADLPYLFGPISVLLGCNLILFPTTVYHIYKSHRLTKLGGMKSNMLKHKIRFFGKLFILAGITWVFEVISWACTQPGKQPHWIWKFFDLVNILQAVAIFVVFVVCNRKILHELSDKLPCLKRLSSIMEKASGVATNSQTRRASHTHVSSMFEPPPLDTIELSGEKK